MDPDNSPTGPFETAVSRWTRTTAPPASGALLGLSTPELQALLGADGIPAYRGAQVAHWLYVRSARAYAQMTNLPKPVQDRLAATHQIGRSEILSSSQSTDGTVKLLLRLSDGNTVETVGLPYTNRTSCCVSTQVGCPMGCVFCATGLSGYVRNLTAGEIVDQVLSVQEYLRERDGSPAGNRTRIDHVTFMGMGEPLLNYAATMQAVQVLNGEMGIAMRHVTISTVGFVPGILKLARAGLQLTLAVSLHAPSDELRHRLVPGMTRYGVKHIVAACRTYVRQTGRRVTFEYCLLKGVNDSVDEAESLAALLRGLNCHVNLIAFNPVDDPRLSGPSRDALRRFREALSSHGIQVTQRMQRGADVDAACGQLRRRTHAAD